MKISGIEKNDGNSKSIKKSFLRETKSIILIVLVVFSLRSVFFEPFKIPSGSMIPTLLIGDFILVNKFAYGFKIPFSDMFTDPVYITKSTSPKRGEVIVFKYPKDESLNFIKRVVAVPGDTVEIVNKKLFINDEEVKVNQIDGKEYVDDMDEKFKNYDFKFFNAIQGDNLYVLQLDKENNYNSYFPRTVVPENKYFVLGDNRDFSMDSRFWGFVPFENIKGRAMLIWFSVSIPMPWDGDDVVFSFRPWRIGKSIL